MNSPFGCKWKCSWRTSDGVCTGGTMCTSQSTPTDCENSPFGCKWISSCPGWCTGGSMCKKSSQGECENSPYDCKWKCSRQRGGGDGGVCTARGDTGGTMCREES